MKDLEFNLKYEAERGIMTIEEPLYCELTYEAKNITDILDSIKDYIENFVIEKKY